LTSNVAALRGLRGEPEATVADAVIERLRTEA
jgi:hypothetical protein